MLWTDVLCKQLSFWVGVSTSPFPLVTGQEARLEKNKFLRELDEKKNFHYNGHKKYVKIKQHVYKKCIFVFLLRELLAGYAWVISPLIRHRHMTGYHPTRTSQHLSCMATRKGFCLNNSFVYVYKLIFAVNKCHLKKKSLTFISKIKHSQYNKHSKISQHSQPSQPICRSI